MMLFSEIVFKLNYICAANLQLDCLILDGLG